ncbi:unnamed protein product, partial [Prorocentrum cordatum]
SRSGFRGPRSTPSGALPPRRAAAQQTMASALARHPLLVGELGSTAELGFLAQRPWRKETVGKELPDQGLPAIDRGWVSRAAVQADAPPASTVDAPAPRRLQRVSSQPLKRRGQAGILESVPCRHLASHDVHPDGSGVRSWPLTKQRPQQLASSAGAHCMMTRSQPCKLCGCVVESSLAVRRGLAIFVDTRWRLSKDGVPRNEPSAASRLLNGSSAGIASRICSSCAGDSSLDATKPCSAKHVRKEDLGDALTSFPGQMPTCPRSSRDASEILSWRTSTGSTASAISSAGSASPWLPRDWSMHSCRVRGTHNEQRKSKFQQRAWLTLIVHSEMF